MRPKDSRHDDRRRNDRTPVGAVGECGFTLVELSMVCAIAAVLAMLGGPLGHAARLEAREGDARALLQALHHAQLVFDAEMRARGWPSHYGFLGELTAQANLREIVSEQVVWGRKPLERPLVSRPFVYRENGIWESGDYLFRIGLPDAQGEWSFERRDRPAPEADPRRGEGRYVAWAWPREAGYFGRRSFSIGLGDGRTGEVQEHSLFADPPSASSSSGARAASVAPLEHQLATVRWRVVLQTVGLVGMVWGFFGSAALVVRRRKGVAPRPEAPRAGSGSPQVNTRREVSARIQIVLPLILSLGALLLGTCRFPFSARWLNQGCCEAMAAAARFSGIDRPMP